MVRYGQQVPYKRSHELDSPDEFGIPGLVFRCPCLRMIQDVLAASLPLIDG